MTLQRLATLAGLAAGTYSVTVTDASGCISIGSATVVSVGSGPALTSSVTDVLCNGESTGSATITATGSVSPYSYQWDAPAGNQTSQTATGLAVGAVIIRSRKKINLVPSAMMGKLMVTLIALLFADNLVLKGNDSIIIPLMCIMCVAIPFVLITLAPRYISAAEVNLFFLLETILGPIWVWLVIKEQPSTETIIGGIIISYLNTGYRTINV